VQPANKETGPGILLPLMFIYKRCPEAIVALFPSDHFILEEDRFINHVHLAAQAVNYEPTRIVLLAIEPHEPETITDMLFRTKTSADLADSEPDQSQRSLKSPEQTRLSSL
jgi:mannose-1-phosphate guanylyltransferase